MDSITRPRSRVKQFYSEFNSSPSSSDSGSDAGFGANFFTFNVPKAPKIRRENDSQSPSTLSSKSYSRPLISPGFSQNQDLKDVAFDSVFSRRIQTLKSKIGYAHSIKDLQHLIGLIRLLMKTLHCRNARALTKVYCENPD